MKKAVPLLENTKEFRNNDSALVNVLVNSIFSMSLWNNTARTELSVKALQDLRCCTWEEGSFCT